MVLAAGCRSLRSPSITRDQVEALFVPTSAALVRMLTNGSAPLIPTECAGSFARTLLHDTFISTTFEMVFAQLIPYLYVLLNDRTTVNFPAAGCTLDSVQAGQGCLLTAMEPVSQTSLQVCPGGL